MKAVLSKYTRLAFVLSKIATLSVKWVVKPADSNSLKRKQPGGFNGGEMVTFVPQGGDGAYQIDAKGFSAAEVKLMRPTENAVKAEPASK